MPFCKVCRYRSDEGDLLVEGAGAGWDEGRFDSLSRADESSPQGRAFMTAQPVVCGDCRVGCRPRTAALLCGSWYHFHRGRPPSSDAAGEPYGGVAKPDHTIMMNIRSTS